MRVTIVSTVLLALLAGRAAACEGGVVAMIYQPAGAVFTAEVNGVPIADALKPGETFTGTRRLPMWLLPGQNEVVVRTETPSADGVVEVFLNCPNVDVASPGDNPNSFGAASLGEAGTQSFTFKAPDGAAMDMPYSNAVHAGDEGLDAAVKDLQAKFQAKDAAALAPEYATMAQVAQAMGHPIKVEQFEQMLGQVLPKAEIAYLDSYEIREAMGGRLRVVTGPDRVTPPIMMDAGRQRMKSGRIWSFIDGDWRLIAQ